MTKNDKSLLLDNQLCFSMNAAARSIVSVYMETLRDANLTYPQYLVFIVLLESGELTVSKLGNKLHLNSGTLTPLLKRMEADGLVTRKRSRSDEREVLVTLTPKGEGLHEIAAKARALVVERLGMSELEIIALRKELMEIADRLSVKG